MTERASGWYDDPDDPTQLRYWDGILWSERRMPKVKPGLEASRIGTPSAYDNTPETGVAAPPGQAPSVPQNPYADQRQAYRQSAQPSGAYNGLPNAQPMTPDGQQRLSGWWRRFVAWLIDNIIVGFVGTLLALPWLGAWLDTYQGYIDDVMAAARAGRSTPEIPQQVLTIPVAWMMAMLAVYAVYEIGFLVWRGRTLGKMATGISVRPVHEARKPTVEEALRRFAVKGIAAILNPIPLLSGLATLFTIVDGLWPLGDSGKQAIHDKVAKTVVVIGPSAVVPQAPESPSVYGPPPGR